jgi:hypothetical protein
MSGMEDLGPVLQLRAGEYENRPLQNIKVHDILRLTAKAIQNRDGID